MAAVSSVSSSVSSVSVSSCSNTPKSPACKESVRKLRTDFYGLRKMFRRKSPIDTPLKGGNMAEFIPEILFELFEFLFNF